MDEKCYFIIVALLLLLFLILFLMWWLCYRAKRCKRLKRQDVEQLTALEGSKKLRHDVQLEPFTDEQSVIRVTNGPCSEAEKGTGDPAGQPEELGLAVDDHTAAAEENFAAIRQPLDEELQEPVSLESMGPSELLVSPQADQNADAAAAVVVVVAGQAALAEFKEEEVKPPPENWVPETEQDSFRADWYKISDSLQEAVPESLRTNHISLFGTEKQSLESIGLEENGKSPADENVASVAQLLQDLGHSDYLEIETDPVSETQWKVTISLRAHFIWTTEGNKSVHLTTANDCDLNAWIQRLWHDAGISHLPNASPLLQLRLSAGKHDFFCVPVAILVAKQFEANLNSAVRLLTEDARYNNETIVISYCSQMTPTSPFLLYLDVVSFRNPSVRRIGRFLFSFPGAIEDGNITPRLAYLDCVAASSEALFGADWWYPDPVIIDEHLKHASHRSFYAHVSTASQFLLKIKITDNTANYRRMLGTAEDGICQLAITPMTADRALLLFITADPCTAASEALSASNRVTSVATAYWHIPIVAVCEGTQCTSIPGIDPDEDTALVQQETNRSLGIFEEAQTAKTELSSLAYKICFSE